MNKTLRTKSSNNRIVILLMIIGLTAIFMSGCGQQPAEPAKNAVNTAPNTTTKRPDHAYLEGYTGETKKQDLKNISLPFAKGQNLTVEVANDGKVIFEKDMILGNVSDLTKSAPPSNDADSSGDKPWMWSKSTIPYVLPDGHAKKDIILEGIKEINSKTNLCLVPRTTETDYVEFVTKDGNWSYIGKVGGRQEISIDRANMGTVAHEIMHAAGFSHMQSREDRDTYVKINLDNVQSGMEHNFQRLTDKSSNRGDYDFNSIMHYPNWAFSINDQNTIDVKGTGDGSNMGQTKAVSAGDIASIAMVYTSPGSCKSAGESKTTAAEKSPEIKAFENNLAGTWVSDNEKLIFGPDRYLRYTDGKLAYNDAYRALDKENIEYRTGEFRKGKSKITFENGNATLVWTDPYGKGGTFKRESNASNLSVDGSLRDKLIGNWMGIAGTNSEKENLSIFMNATYATDGSVNDFWYIYSGNEWASYKTSVNADKTVNLNIFGGSGSSQFKSNIQIKASIDGNVLTVEEDGVTKKFNRQTTFD